MRNVCRTALTMACLALALSCRSALESEGLAIVTLTLPGFDDDLSTVGSRGLLDGWPMGGLPDFSSLIVSVSGPGMSQVTRRLDAYAGSVEIPVPPGGSRLVSVRAVPDWTASAARYPGKPLPTLAKAYAGSASVDVEAGKTASVGIALALAETMILVPNPQAQDTSKLMVADSLASSPVSQYQDLMLSMKGNFVFSGYSLLYSARGGSSVDAYADTAEPYVESYAFSTSVDAIALDEASRRLYGYWYSDGAFLSYFDLSSTPTLIGVDSDPAPSWGNFESPNGGGIAAVGDGLIAMTAQVMDGQVPAPGIALLSVSRQGTTAISSLSAFATSESLGLGYATQNGFTQIAVMDMAYHNGVLLLALAENFQAASRGMVIALDPRTLAVRWKRGWPGDVNYFPTDPETQFYGPARFVGFTESSVYVVDEGIASSNGPNVDRIVELTTADGSIVASGLDGVSEFYTQYQF